jgi:hypothetical protein
MPLFRQLAVVAFHDRDRGRFMDKLIEDHREEIRRLALLCGARRVRVFGSLARGDAGPDSDVDILIDLEKGRSAFALGGLLMDLQELLGKKVRLCPNPASGYPTRLKIPSLISIGGR